MTAFLLIPSLPSSAREVAATAAWCNVEQVISAGLLSRSESGRIVICYGARRSRRSRSSRRSGSIRFRSEKSKATFVRLVEKRRHISWNDAVCFLRRWQWCIDRWSADAKACEAERLTWIGCRATLLGWSCLSSSINDSSCIRFFRTLFASRMTGTADTVRASVFHIAEATTTELAGWLVC